MYLLDDTKEARRVRGKHVTVHELEDGTVNRSHLAPTGPPPSVGRCWRTLVERQHGQGFRGSGRLANVVARVVGGGRLVGGKRPANASLVLRGDAIRRDQAKESWRPRLPRPSERPEPRTHNLNKCILGGGTAATKRVISPSGSSQSGRVQQANSDELIGAAKKSNAGRPPSRGEGNMSFIARR